MCVSVYIIVLAQFFGFRSQFEHNFGFRGHLAKGRGQGAALEGLLLLHERFAEDVPVDHPPDVGHLLPNQSERERAHFNHSNTRQLVKVCIHM